MAYGTVKADVVQSSTAGLAPQFNDGNGIQTGTLCRAWINFNGNSGSVAARASFNVSSVTRSSAGVYSISFTNNLTDANYSATAMTNNQQVYCNISNSTAQTASTLVITMYYVAAATDSTVVCVSIHR
jgi:hypothetical protein